MPVSDEAPDSPLWIKVRATATALLARLIEIDRELAALRAVHQRLDAGEGDAGC